MHSWIGQDDNEQNVWKLIYTDEGSPASCLRFCFLPLRISTLCALPDRMFLSTLRQFPFSPLSPFPYFITITGNPFASLSIHAMLVGYLLLSAGGGVTRDSVRAKPSAGRGGM